MADAGGLNPPGLRAVRVRVPLRARISPAGVAEWQTRRV